MGYALNPARPSSLKGGPARPKNRPGKEDVLRPRPGVPVTSCNGTIQPDVTQQQQRVAV